MMPVMFVGHGSPMNAIEDNIFTKGWQEIASSIPKPDAILVISAHWEAKGTFVSIVNKPKTIHDFFGFPTLANKTLELLDGIAKPDTSWGLDHGAWSVLKVMYPNADIPVFQMSIDEQASTKEHFEIGQKLHSLREINVLILGSGNVVHNLGMLNFSADGGFDWALKFDNDIKEKIEKREFESVMNHRELGTISRYAVPTTDHFNPLLYILGATDSSDQLTIYNNACMAGSLSMTSYVFA